MNRVFADFRKVYQPVEQRKYLVANIYKKYLRGDVTRDIIKNLTTSGNINSEKIEFFGNMITNPTYIMDELLKKKIPITKSLIHGDLHTDNIVINHEGSPRIVDFAWSTTNDIYIDFSQLEMSVRYWGIPFFMNSNSKKNQRKGR